jgi:hypothetical protein
MGGSTNTMDRRRKISWVGFRYTMGSRGQNTMDRESKYHGLEVQYTMGRGSNIPWLEIKISWEGSSIYHGQGVKIQWVGV